MASSIDARRLILACSIHMSIMHEQSIHAGSSARPALSNLLSPWLAGQRVDMMHACPAALTLILFFTHSMQGRGRGSCRLVSVPV
jgi:hypothetical protein